MLRFSTMVCPGCGASLPREALLRVVTCGYCGASVAAEEGRVSAAAYRAIRAEHESEARAVADLSVASVPYRVLGPLARGGRAEVLLAERACRLTERVVVKLWRLDDAEHARREHEALAALSASSVRGAPQMTRRLGQLVATGTAVLRGGEERAAVVVRATSGFVHTLEDVRAAYPGGVEGAHAVWMWKRILELLGWVQRSGWMHGALAPPHLLVHARDHGVAFVSWSRARRFGERAPPPESALAAFDAGLEVAEARADVITSARSIAYVLGGDASGAVPRSVPAPIAELVGEAARGERDRDAWALAESVRAAAYAAYGPPRYVPFRMPGWR